ncbi:hypothetical protein KV337_004872 [Escherichia coli]|uniref:hypothetical protein n=1 Tax=Escherichia TaxID=561 RepID=UPI0007519356|nr:MULTISPECIES: hypothetical protein [Escherichia]EHQ5526859.1 hypothetical protein [Escherichia coli O2]MCZ8771348.1 hypothetical protein [Escherichia albertii]HDQ6571371.1 hypothetical protein [Escherichia coli Ou:H7]HDQ6728330.1 hypothetical protein [Escherichia coli O11:H5]EEW0910999.1 hypothetical protein [Escherichia coli]
MPDLSPLIHEKVRVLLTIENGKVTYSRHLLDNEFAGSMDTFIWLAERAGYTIIPPAGEKDNGPDSNTNS